MSEALIRALLQHLVRRGDLDGDDINAMADGLDAAGEDQAAHLCRLSLIEAYAPTQSEWEAQRRRDRFRIIPDGGKADT